MGFFKNLFKRKEGGTFVGNLFRSVAKPLTGGVLGSGAGLAKWEQEQALKRLEEEEMRLLQVEAQERAALRSKGALGSQVGNQLSDAVITYASNGKGPTDPNMGESIVLTTLKKHWYWFVGGVLVLVAGVWYFTRRSGNKKRQNLA